MIIVVFIFWVVVRMERECVWMCSVRGLVLVKGSIGDSIVLFGVRFIRV